MRWAMKSKGAYDWSLQYQSAKWPPQFYHNFCVEKRTLHQCSVLLRSGLRQFVSLYKGRTSPAVLVQGWRLKSRNLPLLSLALMVGKRHWLLEGKATCQIKHQIENRCDNCILGTIIVRLPDTPLRQEFQIKPPDVLCREVWTTGDETTLLSVCHMVFHQILTYCIPYRQKLTGFSVVPRQHFTHPLEKWVWSTAYSIFVQVCRNAGALFFSNLMLDAIKNCIWHCVPTI